MQKALRKGLRLNEQNRKAIIAQVVNEKMGDELEALESYRDEITVYVERALMDRLTDRQELPAVDLTTIPAGVMPEIKRIYLGEGFANREDLVEFAEPVRVPHEFYAQGSLNTYDFKFTEEQNMTLRQYADKAFDVESRAKEMRTTMMTFLNGFTSPQKLLIAAPEFEKYLDPEMYDDEAATEQVSLDDILSMSGAPKSDAEDSATDGDAKSEAA